MAFADDPPLPTLAKLAQLSKAPRPPHVILLSDVIAEVAKHQQLGGIVVAWYEPEADGLMFRLVTLGADDPLIALCERTKLSILTDVGELEVRPTPTDAP